MGINISQSKIIVFKNDFGYSTAISNKKQDGTYERMYVNLQLPKGVEVENKTYIEITKGFLAFFKDKNGLPKLKIVAMEIKQDEPKQEVQADFYDSESLPF